MPKQKIETISLYNEIHGRGEPLLLIAGLGSDSSSWGSVLKPFSARFQTIVFDNRGSGRSSLMKKPYTIRRLADDVITLLDYLGIKRVHVLGHSMGGYIAQELAINYPGRINKLVLESTSFVSSKRNNLLFKGFLKRLRPDTDYEAWLRAWLPWLFSPKTLKNKKFMEMFIKLAGQYPYRQTAEGFSGQVRAIASFDARERVKKIRAKTLIIEGEKDRLIVPREAKRLAEKIAGSEFCLLKNTGHSLHVESPKLFAKTVLRFLAFPDITGQRQSLR